MTHLENADGQGQLLIEDRLSPVSYTVKVERQDERLAAMVEVHAPRDWLIKLGFRRQATLVLASGDRVEVKHDHDIDVSDALSVVLVAEPLDYRGSDALEQAFPELKSPDSR